MVPRLFQIGHIPAALWGLPSNRVIVAVHGAQSSKTDVPFRLLAEAFPHCQVLSFDLPEHGDRRNGPALCKPPICVRELSAVLDYAESRWKDLGLFAVSMGAYFSLLACQGRSLSHAWFLSPVADMERLTRDMMGWFQISEARLEAEGSIPTPMGQTLYWDDYCYIRRHPIECWPFPTDILRGSGDTLVAEETVAAFAERFSCRLRTVEGAEHWFHTQPDLEALSDWLRETFPG
ncbi:alpha/beta hydrolase [Oscillibacter sp.]|uniref:alpha/beta hydrolase n=1 Tax=Oscillibacter sp. TaxID=1945593 RepID=UPI002D7E8448|nr:alpha/beta hydrolase [Oscillibacter sp.]